jgi:tetratricopeptide (TPR) repeat protein
MRKAAIFSAVSAVVLMTLVAGCKAREDKSGSAVAPAALIAPAPPTAETRLARARSLALAKPGPPPGSEVDRAIENAQRALERNPRKSDWWIFLGRGWVRKARESSDPGYHLNAKACADIALDLEPDNRLAKHLEGLVLMNDHKFTAARDLAEKLVLTDAEDPSAYGILSDSLLELGRYDEAMSAAQKMVDLKPNLPSYSRAAYLQWVRGDLRAARESVRLAIDSGRDRRDPEPEAWTIVQAATMFWQEGDLEGAEAGFDKALDWMPEYPPALVGKGRVALAKGDAARASELLARAYKQSPLVETAWLLGDARAEAGDAKGAAEAWALVEKTGKASDPRGLSLFLSTKNKSPILALSLAEEEKKSRGDVATEDAYAWALYRGGKFEEAKVAIDHARRYGTKEPTLLFHQGAIHLAAGAVDSGRKLLAEALALNPRFDVTGAAEAKRLLETTQSVAKR